MINNTSNSLQKRAKANSAQEREKGRASRHRGASGRRQKVKKERKHRREEQGGRKNQPGQGDSAQVQREEERAATEGDLTRDTILISAIA